MQNGRREWFNLDILKKKLILNKADENILDRWKFLKSHESSAFFCEIKLSICFNLWWRFFGEYVLNHRIDVFQKWISLNDAIFYLYFQIVRAKSVYVILAFSQGHLVLMVKVRNL